MVQLLQSKLMLEGKILCQLFVYKNQVMFFTLSEDVCTKYFSSESKILIFQQCNCTGTTAKIVILTKQKNLIFRKNAPNPKWPSKYDRVIVLVRDPFDALLAEFNRNKAQPNFRKNFFS